MFLRLLVLLAAFAACSFAQQCPQGFTLTGGVCVQNASSGGAPVTGCTAGYAVVGATSTTLACTAAVQVISGNLVTTGSVISGSGGGVGGALLLGQGTAAALGTNAISLMAPASIVSYGLKYPGAAPSANNVLVWGAPAGGVSTGTFSAVPLLGSTNVFSANSSTGTPSYLNTGTWGTGPTACHVLIQPAGTTSFTLAGGAAFCINQPTGNTANFITLGTNGSNGTQFSVGNTGLVTAAGNINAGGSVSAATWLTWALGAKNLIGAPSDGVIELTNAAAADFNRMQWGGVTNAFPAIARSGTKLVARLADASGSATWEGKHNSSDSSAGITGSTCTAWKDGLCVTP